MDFLTDLVDSAFEETGENSNYSPAFLSGWFLDNSNLGKLNNLIDTEFSGTFLLDVSGAPTGGAIIPDMNGEQQAIYKKLFEYDYYSKEAKKALVGMAGIAPNDWISLKEGDSEITRVNKNEMVKTLRGLSRDARADLEFMVMQYLKFNTCPEQVVGDDMYSAGFYNFRSDTYDNVRNRFNQ